MKEKDFYTLEEIEDEFIWEIQMILYNLLVYKTNKKECFITCFSKSVVFVKAY